MKIIYQIFFLSFFLICKSLSVYGSQSNNPTNYPYGGQRDSSRFIDLFMEKVPLTFTLANFSGEKFKDNADFNNALFLNQAYFKNTHFIKTALFNGVTFDSLVTFEMTKFYDTTSFNNALFLNRAYFKNTHFIKTALFNGVTFDSLVTFEMTKFYDTTNFDDNVRFKNDVDFSKAIFVKQANWSNDIYFEKSANFDSANFQNQTSFKDADFYGDVIFKDAIFQQKVVFFDNQFKGPSYFLGTQFQDSVEFRKIDFLNMTNFSGSNIFKTVLFLDCSFKHLAIFKNTVFDDSLKFISTTFDSIAYFVGAKFNGYCDFRGIRFDSSALFMGTYFEESTYFNKAIFNNQVDFWGSSFLDNVEFRNTKFSDQANFKETKFFGSVDYRDTVFGNKVNFKSAIFNKQVDFRGAKFGYLAVPEFKYTVIRDKVLIGLKKSRQPERYDSVKKILTTDLLEFSKDELQKIIAADTVKPLDLPIFDFRQARLDKAGKHNDSSTFPGAQIILYGTVDLKIQLEKLAFISLCDTLDYYSKKDIITTLKDVSFQGDKYKKERFELDYIFAKSTIYQLQSSQYVKNRWYHIWRWPKLTINFVYYITMGIGYRPFRLLYWVLTVIVCYTLFFAIKMPQRINAFLSSDAKNNQSNSIDQNTSKFYLFLDHFINCFYFSSIIFFTIRLKKDLLLFFTAREKKIIVFEWLLGFIIYISFIYFAKSGSILHNIASLFSD